MALLTVLLLGGLATLPGCRSGQNEAQANVRAQQLFAAAKRGRTGDVWLLIRNGADVNVRNQHNETPLHLAVAGGHMEITRQLLGAGAEVNVPDAIEGRTPLYYAVLHGNEKLASLLLSVGADPNATLTTGEPLLVTAAKRGDGRIVTMLEAAGATEGREMAERILSTEVR